MIKMESSSVREAVSSFWLDGAVVTIKVKAGDKVLNVEGLLHIDKENDIVILKVKGVNLQTVKVNEI